MRYYPHAAPPTPPRARTSLSLSLSLCTPILAGVVLIAALLMLGLLHSYSSLPEPLGMPALHARGGNSPSTRRSLHRQKHDQLSPHDNPSFDSFDGNTRTVEHSNRSSQWPVLQLPTILALQHSVETLTKLAVLDDLPFSPPKTRTCMFEDVLAELHEHVHSNESTSLLNAAAVSLYGLSLLALQRCEELVDLQTDTRIRPNNHAATNAHVLLLSGYCFEGRGNADTARNMYAQAKEACVSCEQTLAHKETFLDRMYQPSVYNTHEIAVTPEQYMDTLVRLLIFRICLRFAHELSLWPLTHTMHRRLFGTRKLPRNELHDMSIGYGFNEEQVSRAREFFEVNEFVVLRDMLHPGELTILRRYYERMVQLKLTSYDEYLGRATSYNDRVGMWLNQAWNDVVETIIGQKIKHAYSFLCHYESLQASVKPFLRPHTDREDNQFTVSIQLFSDQQADISIRREHPDISHDVSWPIYVDSSTTLPARSSWRDTPSMDICVECDMRDGDALVFMGTRHVHFREELPRNAIRVTSLLLHFVHVAFDFVDYKLVRQRKDPTI